MGFEGNLAIHSDSKVWFSDVRKKYGSEKNWPVRQPLDLDRVCGSGLTITFLFIQCQFYCLFNKPLIFVTLVNFEKLKKKIESFVTILWNHMCIKVSKFWIQKLLKNSYKIAIKTKKVENRYSGIKSLDSKIFLFNNCKNCKNLLIS